jgi:hypothetical protein
LLLCGRRPAPLLLFGPDVIIVIVVITGGGLSLSVAT